MPNQGHARAIQAQAFGKSSGGGLLFRLAAIGLVLTGLTLAIVAVVTAAAPVATDPIRVVLDVMSRLGLDKGPAAFFGVAFFGLGLAILRGGGTGGSSDAADAAAYASQTAGDVEDLTAIVATLQGELGSLRHEVGEARREIHESTQSADPSADGGNTASDPIFRLAASLDQLGARVDKRIDGARKEMLEAVEAMSETVRSVTKEQTEAAREQRAEFEGLRMDMADLHAEVSRVGEDGGNGGDPAHPTVGGSASMPRELSETPAPLSLPDDGSRQGEAQSTPVAPLPTPTPETRADAEFDFPSPPPPIPQPSEGLELLDDMEDDVARDADKAPPLFPDLDKKGF